MKANCPACGAEVGQVKNGKNPSGSHRSYCTQCGRNYTLEPKRTGHSREKVKYILRDYVQEKVLLLRERGELIALTEDGTQRLVPFPKSSDAMYRRIGRLHHVHHQTVKAWVLKWHESRLPVLDFLNTLERT
jgi:hypothetical protein